MSVYVNVNEHVETDSLEDVFYLLVDQQVFYIANQHQMDLI